MPITSISTVCHVSIGFKTIQSLSKFLSAFILSANRREVLPHKLTLEVTDKKPLEQASKE